MIIYWIAYFIVWLLSKFYCRCTYHGKENIPQQGPYILASNHLSNIDPFILGMSARRHWNFMAKESLFKTPMLRFFFYRFGAFPIRRHSSDLGALKEALRRLKKGEPLVIFPEGTRTLQSTERIIEPGVGFIAAKAKVVVIPAYIEGSQYVLPKGKKMLYPHQIVVKIGKPLYFKDRQDYETISKEIMDSILSLS